MQQVIKKFPEEIVQKAKKIRAIVTDVDGVLSNGGIIYDGGKEEWKQFNVKDGQIVRPLRENAIIVAAITGRNSPVVKRRLEELNFDYHVHGRSDKINYFEEILSTFELQSEEICYIGDDLTDIPCLKAAGLGVCPEDAIEYVKYYADFISTKRGGEGVFREIGDLILASQGNLEKVVQQYLVKK
ncbi:HAD hydrolase family protein [Marivirga sp. S37H4]|uniref:3-deoxy-D-manno-octulosonate 8-phosphate phosphatase KdsC n=2 Tax=Marivirga aurantiaca TaxID=2802615 RepID=A0A935C820_9BACT|nr:HAD hydrolase family protein [Marivirga aurantiaca]